MVVLLQTSIPCNGSAGNPYGSPGQGSWGPSRATGGNNGTGGVIVIFVRGSVSGSGDFNVRGENIINQASRIRRGPGQGSGAGMISCFCGSYSGSGITLTTARAKWRVRDFSVFIIDYLLKNLSYWDNINMKDLCLLMVNLLIRCHPLGSIASGLPLYFKL